MKINKILGEKNPSDVLTKHVKTDVLNRHMIGIGMTRLLFTDKDFDSQDSALQHYKKVGERMQVTTYSPRLPHQEESASENQV